MNGAANRKRGHAAELAVVHYLRANGWPDAATTRSRLGHDGSRQPGDICGFDDRISLEVKDVKSSCWPTWLRQAEEQAEGRVPVVVRRLRGNPDVGYWPVVISTRTPSVVLKKITFADLCDWVGPRAVVTR